MTGFRLTFICLWLFGYIFSTYGQSKDLLWRAVAPNEVNLDVRLTGKYPVDKSHLFEVNYNTLADALLSDPFDQNWETEIMLPTPGGQLEVFRVINSLVLPEGLQKQYPQIRTFKAQAIHHPEMIARIGLSYDGFYGSLAVGTSEYLIHTILDNNKNVYAIYNISDGLAAAERIADLACGVDHEHLDIAGHDDHTINIRSEERRMRHYKIGIACTSTFAADVGATTEIVLAKVTQVINQVNLRYNLDLGIQLNLIEETPTLFNLSPDTDYFTIQKEGRKLLDQSQLFFGLKLDPSAYDLGQTWTTDCTDVGGVANLASVCTNNKSRGVTCGPKNVAYFLVSVKHEIGHMFSARHTFNRCGDSDQLDLGNAYEPGSGSTIMAYPGGCGGDNIASAADDYFHISNIISINNFVTSSNNCGTIEGEVNHTPDIILPQYMSDLLTIPASTPYELIGDAIDADGDQMIYNWEQFDLGNGEPLGTNYATGPLNRSNIPSAANRVRIVPRLPSILTSSFDVTDRMPTVSREMNWRFNVRDQNPNAGATVSETFKFNVTTDAGPFKMTFPNTSTDSTIMVGQYFEVLWDVANTDKAPVNAKFVDIFYSIDGGNTFVDTLVLGTPNDGREHVVIPKAGNNVRFKVKASESIFFDITRKSLRANAPANPGYSYDVFPHNARICPSAPAQFEVRRIDWGGFEDNVHVELVGGWPTGVIVTIDKNDLAFGEKAIVTVDASQTLEGGQFRILLRSVANDGEIIFRYIDVDIAPTDLVYAGTVSPANGSTGITQTPTIEWLPIAHADYYEFVLASSPGFAAQDIIGTYTGPNTSYVHPNVLDAGKVYYWRVIGLNDCLSGTPSIPQSFQTLLNDCRTVNGDGLPKPISSNISAPPVETSFEINDFNGNVSDVNVNNITLTHDDISKLEIRVQSPSGQNVLVFGNKCFSRADMNAGFDDEALNDIDCSKIKQGVSHRPVSALSAFDDTGISGTWKVIIKTVAGGSAGQFQSASLTVCGSVTGSEIIKVNNNVIPVKTGAAQVVTQQDLRYRSSQSDDAEVYYTILSLPKHGTITAYGQTLKVGDQISQGTINQWSVSYIPDNDIYEGLDDMVIALSDNHFGFLAPETVEFDLNKNNTISTMSVKNERFTLDVYPNPTNGMVHIAVPEQAKGKKVTLAVRNMNGQIVHHATAQIAQGLISLDVANFPAGVYYIGMSSETFVGQAKLIKLQ